MNPICKRCKKRIPEDGFKTCKHCRDDREAYRKHDISEDGTEELTIDKATQICDRHFNNPYGIIW